MLGQTRGLPQKFQIWKARRLQSQVATNRKTVFVNIIIIVLQLAYKTETLKKNNFKKKYFNYKTQNLKKQRKNTKTLFRQCQKNTKNNCAKTQKILGVCN